jgi:predicted O-methyltransferase YrrM
MKELLLSGYAYTLRPKLPSQHFLDLCSEASSRQISMGDILYTRSNTNPFELYCLMALIAAYRPSRIFEIGTFDGATTLRMAQIAPDADIITLDLPPNQLPHATELDGEHALARAGDVGIRFRGTPASSRIKQVLGNSRTFDYSSFFGTCDFVFVDACHEYEFVRVDSQNALKLLRRGGTVVWHDYVPGWPGVIKAVDELLPDHSIVHIAGTSLAVLRDNAG